MYNYEKCSSRFVQSRHCASTACNMHCNSALHESCATHFNHTVKGTAQPLILITGIALCFDYTHWLKPSTKKSKEENQSKPRKPPSMIFNELQCTTAWKCQFWFCWLLTLHPLAFVSFAAEREKEREKERERERQTDRQIQIDRDREIETEAKRGSLPRHWDRSRRSNTFYLTLTPGQTVPELTIYCQVPGKVATREPVFKSLVWLNPEKFPHRKRESKPRSAALEADALTTRPRRQYTQGSCLDNRARHKERWSGRNGMISSYICTVLPISQIACLQCPSLFDCLWYSTSKQEDLFATKETATKNKNRNKKTLKMSDRKTKQNKNKQTYTKGYFKCEDVIIIVVVILINTMTLLLIIPMNIAIK